jgi:hypothetical protein
MTDVNGHIRFNTISEFGKYLERLFTEFIFYVETVKNTRYIDMNDFEKISLWGKIDNSVRLNDVTENLIFTDYEILGTGDLVLKFRPKQNKIVINRNDNVYISRYFVLSKKNIHLKHLQHLVYNINNSKKLYPIKNFNPNKSLDKILIQEGWNTNKNTLVKKITGVNIDSKNILVASVYFDEQISIKISKRLVTEVKKYLDKTEVDNVVVDAIVELLLDPVLYVDNIFFSSITKDGKTMKEFESFLLQKLPYFVYKFEISSYITESPAHKIELDESIFDLGDNNDSQTENRSKEILHGNMDVYTFVKTIAKNFDNINVSKIITTPNTFLISYTDEPFSIALSFFYT